MEAPQESVGRLLEDAHGRIDSLLANVRRLAASGDPKAAKAFEKFRGALLEHIAIEESLIFPAFDRSAAPRDLTATLRAEHEQIRGRLDSIAEAIQRRAPLDGLVMEFMALLCSHEDEEETKLIPAVEENLSVDDRLALASRLRAL